MLLGREKHCHSERTSSSRVIPEESIFLPWVILRSEATKNLFSFTYSIQNAGGFPEEVSPG